MSPNGSGLRTDSRNPDPTQLRRLLRDVTRLDGVSVQPALTAGADRRNELLDVVGQAVLALASLTERVRCAQELLTQSRVRRTAAEHELAFLTGRATYQFLDSAATAAANLPRRLRTPVSIPQNDPPAREAPAHEPPAPEVAPGTPRDIIELAQVALLELGDWLTEASVAAAKNQHVLTQARKELRSLSALLTGSAKQFRGVLALETRAQLELGQATAAEQENAAVKARASSRLLEAAARPVRAAGIGDRLAERTRRRLEATSPAERDDRSEAAGAPRAVGWPIVPWLWYQDSESGEAALGLIDQPADHEAALESEPLLVAGWALNRHGPVAKVEVFVNGRSTGLARTGYVRRDVAGEYQVPHAVASGFDHLIAPEYLAGAETVAIEVRVETLSGRRSLLGTRHVSIARSAAPAALPPVAPASTQAPDSSTTPFNLLVATHDLGYGGGQLWLSELLERSGAGRDFPCTVMAPASGPLIPSLQALGISVHVNGNPPMDDLNAFDGRLEETAEWAAEQGFSAVLSNTFLAVTGPALAARLGIPSVWAIHESWPPSVFWSIAHPPGLLDRGVRRRCEKNLAAADAVVFEAEATRELYEGAIAKGAGRVIHYGISASDIDAYCARTDRHAARAQLGLSPDARILLMMGTIEPRKSQSLLTLAFREIAEQHPDAQLVLVGGTGTEFVVGLEDYIERAGLGARVHVVPIVSDAYPWYRAADALVCASDVESLPRSVLEAMAFGLPILATTVFGLPELLTDGETGLLYPPRDLTEAVAALDRLLRMDRKRLQAIADAGRRLVRADYDSRGYAEGFTELLRELAGKADENPAG